MGYWWHLSTLHTTETHTSSKMWSSILGRFDQLFTFPLDRLPRNLFPEQLHAIKDLLDNKTTPVID